MIIRAERLRATISSDGNLIVSGSWDGTLKLWDVKSGEMKRSIGGVVMGTNCIDINHEGDRLAAGCGDFAIRLWEASTGTLTQTLTGHTTNIGCVKFRPNTKEIASVSQDKTIRFWDLDTGAELRKFSDVHFMNVVTFNQDGTKFVTAGAVSDIKLRDSETGKVIQVFKGHTKSVNCLSISLDGKKLVSGGDLEIKIWDIESGREMASLTGSLGLVCGVEFNPDGSRIASAGYDRTIKIWDCQTGEELRSLSGHSEFVTSVKFSPDGKKLVSSSWDGAVKLWDATPLEETTKQDELLLHERQARAKPAYHQEQARIAEASKNWFAAAFHRAWLLKLSADATSKKQFVAAYRKLLAQNRGAAPLNSLVMKNAVESSMPNEPK